MSSITWLGHSAFQIETGNRTLFIDPWINKNSQRMYNNANDVQKADIVFISHDHDDHGYQEGIEICKRLDATFVAVYDLALKAENDGVAKIAPGNIGGEIMVDDIKIYFAQAIHSCEVGVPCGFVIESKDLTIYYTGDTAFYSDMSLLSKLYNIDVLILPICSKFTMGFREAIWAIESIKPKVVIPCHYDVFPETYVDPYKFKELVGLKAKVEILEHINKTQIAELLK